MQISVHEFYQNQLHLFETKEGEIFGNTKTKVAEQEPKNIENPIDDFHAQASMVSEYGAHCVIKDKFQQTIKHGTYMWHAGQVLSIF